MKYRITTVRSNETGFIIYWCVEYKPSLFSFWRKLNTYNSEGKYTSFSMALDTIAQHNLLVSMDRLVKSREVFV